MPLLTTPLPLPTLKNRISQHCSLGGIISPLLANIALSVLDEHFCAKWDAHTTPYRREVHRKRGGATYRIVRYADDFVIMVAGTQAHAEALWTETAEVIAPLGLRLSAEKTRVCHLDEGFDFLGFADPTAPEEGQRQAHRLHLPVEESVAFHHGEGAGVDGQSAASQPR